MEKETEKGSSKRNVRWVTWILGMQQINKTHSGGSNETTKLCVCVHKIGLQFDVKSVWKSEWAIVHTHILNTHYLQLKQTKNWLHNDMCESKIERKKTTTICSLDIAIECQPYPIFGKIQNFYRILWTLFILETFVID